MNEEEQKIIDVCPICGKKSLVLFFINEHIIRYAIKNSDEKNQEWKLLEDFDTGDELLYIECISCGEKFEDFVINDDDALVSLLGE